MATDATTLNVQARDPEGSRANRRLRREGRVPAVIYGGGGDILHVSVDAREFRHAVLAAGAVLTLTMDGQTTSAMVKDAQRHPVRGEAMHVDFLRVDLTQTIQSTAVIELVGAEDAPGHTQGGVLEQQLRDINIEALPGDIPESITVDVSGLELGATVTVADVTAPKGVEILDDAETVVASMTLPRLEVETEEGVETETEVVGEGEGEALAPADADAEAQPETSGAGDGEQPDTTSE
jgi:large subunit ribosomal protein L25